MGPLPPFFMVGGGAFSAPMSCFQLSPFDGLRVKGYEESAGIPPRRLSSRARLPAPGLPHSSGFSSSATEFRQ